MDGISKLQRTGRTSLGSTWRRLEKGTTKERRGRLRRLRSLARENSACVSESEGEDGCRMRTSLIKRLND